MASYAFTVCSLPYGSQFISSSREVHAQLFTRHADGLRLAAHGEGFLRHAEHMLTTLAAAVEETRSAVSSVTGQVRIAITDTVSVSEYLLPKVIAVWPTASKF